VVFLKSTTLCRDCVVAAFPKNKWTRSAGRSIKERSSKNFLGSKKGLRGIQGNWRSHRKLLKYNATLKEMTQPERTQWQKAGKGGDACFPAFHLHHFLFQCPITQVCQPNR